MKFKDYYKILELDDSKVTIDQIKSAYRKLAKKYHPDLNVGDKLAEEKIKDINEAYKILSDFSSKRKYDRTWNYNIGRKKNKSKTSGQMAGEFFGMFFGNNDQKEEIDQPKAIPERGQDIETEINVTIEEGFFGASKTIVLKDITGKDRTVKVKLPEGIQNSEKIKVAGQGKVGKNGGKNGDLFIKINIVNGKKYQLNGKDLYTTIPITPWEAALGTRLQIDSIDDSKTQIYIPNGVQAGEIVKIPEKGYKTQDGKRGELIGKIEIVVPEKLTQEEKEVFKKLKEISKFNPRRV
mgnify:FL=1